MGYLQVTVDTEAPSYSIKMLNSSTAAEGGPQWVRRLFAAMQGDTRSSSTTVVNVVPEAERSYRLQSNIAMRIDMQIPDWVLVPIASMEKSGSGAIQKMLQKDAGSSLDKFQRGYLRWKRETQQ